jgi:hypothetical protein
MEMEVSGTSTDACCVSAWKTAAGDGIGAILDEAFARNTIVLLAS